MTSNYNSTRTGRIWSQASHEKKITPTPEAQLTDCYATGFNFFTVKLFFQPQSILCNLYCIDYTASWENEDNFCVVWLVAAFCARPYTWFLHCFGAFYEKRFAVDIGKVNYYNFVKSNVVAVCNIFKCK